MSRRRSDRSHEHGQATVEFAIIAPVAFMLLFGLISGCFLFYQNSALHDGASAGARTASIETSLATENLNTTTYCESGSPQSIEQAIASAAPDLNVDTAHNLCGTSTGGTGSAGAATVTQLTQTGVLAGRATITVTCGGNCSAPTSVSVALTYTTKGLAAPMNLTYTLSASSEVAVLVP